MRYSLEPTYRRYVQGYGKKLMDTATKVGTSKYGKKIIDTTKKTRK